MTQRATTPSTMGPRAVGMISGLLCALLLGSGCYAGIDDGAEREGSELDVEPIGPDTQNSCGPLMSVFPVAAAHNIGWDPSCANGCPVSCPDEHANSDWNPGASHNGIDIFAHEGADLVAVADGEVVGVGTVSDTSGIRVKIKDDCGWSYYYGHLQSATVSLGQRVSVGERIGYMGHTGTSSTHLHFNVSPGSYLEDINPFDLLVQTSPTACGGAPEPEPPAPEPDPSGGEPLPPDEPPALPPEGSCGALLPGDALGVEEPLTSCDGRFSVLLQSDGNVVLYQDGSSAALWNSQTAGQPGVALIMQEDGNLVLYPADGVAIWHTVTYGHPGSYLAMQDDGNLVVYEGGTPLWWSGTGGH